MDRPADKNELRVLMLEDVPSDAELAKNELLHAGLVFTPLCVVTREAFEKALDEFKPDIILADYHLPAYNGRDALEYARRTHPQIPVIVLTGALGDEAAVELVKLGAKDYVLKGSLARLAPAIKRALSEEKGVRNRKLAEGKYRALFSEAMEGIALIDCDTGQVVDCNPEFERQAGRTREQVRELKVWEALPAEEHELVRQRFLEIIKTGSGHGSDFELQGSGGNIIPIEYAAKRLNIQGQCFIQVFTHDITERKQAERTLRESEKKYRRLFETTKNGILILDAETGKILDANPFFLGLLSFSPGECIGKMLWEIGLFRDIEDSKMVFQELQTHEYIRYEDFPLDLKGGRRIDVEFASNLYEIDDRKVIQCNIRDITERLRAERALHESEEKFRTITASANDAIIMIDSEARISYWNEAAGKIFGHPAHEAFGKPLHDLLAPKRFHDDFRKGFGHFKETGEGAIVGKTVELVALRKDGLEFPIELSLSAIKRDGLWNAIGIVRDISERKADEARLKLFRKLIDHSSDAIEVNDPATLRFVDVNETACRSLGYSRDELLTMRTQDIDRDVSESQLKKIGEGLQEHGSVMFESLHCRKDGSKFPVEVSLTSVQIDKEYGVSVVRDITERKHAEDALRRANRALRTLSAGNVALVRAANEDELLRAVTKSIVETGGYRMAWVGYAEDDAAKTVRPVAQYGYEEGYLDSVDITWADTERGQGPTGTAIREGATVSNQDFLANHKMSPWREEAIKRGYRSSIAIPLVRLEHILGALTIYSSEPSAFGKEEVALLEELANDLAFGIETLRTRVAHEQHSILLRQSLEQSIQTIAGTVEARDPYTAGHQRRVGELATAIAREMGLPYEQVNGIHLAAIIHDLGKIKIPAEILSKPGKLSDIEFLLIKSHPQIGYDILKDVKFPWPIADIVLQHHEKLDGSGYPQGLKGGQILLESRIMTVADVVEAMSSHRPYRSALGIDAALHEIERGRGTLYDPAIVDVCLTLFTKKGFKFSK